jgi:hypothetical protein
MKQSLIITTLLIILLSGNVKGQKGAIDTVFWDNGNFILVSELINVWIFETNGRTHKKVKIHTIDTLSGKIEYYLEGTYHDVLISNIESIAPAKFYDNAILFDTKKIPAVRMTVLDGDPSNDVRFKSHKRVNPIPVITRESEQTPVTETNQSVSKTNEVYDEIIFATGKKILVKIVSTAGGNVSYMRADLLNGPLYIVSLLIPGTSLSAKITSTDHKIIDYRN